MTLQWARPWLIFLFRITFLAFDEPESKFALNEAASSAGGIIGLLATKAVTDVAPATVPVSVVNLVS